MAFMETESKTEVFQFTTQATVPYVATRYLNENPPESVPAELSIPKEVSVSTEPGEETMELLANIPMRTIAILGVVVGILNFLKRK